MIKVGDRVRVRDIVGTYEFAGLTGKVVEIDMSNLHPEYSIYEIFIEKLGKSVNFYNYKLEKLGSLDIKISI